MQACGKNKPVVYDFSTILSVSSLFIHAIFFGFLFLQTRILSRASLSFSKIEVKMGDIKDVQY
jgi:hypothetical protein